MPISSGGQRREYYYVFKNELVSACTRDSSNPSACECTVCMMHSQCLRWDEKEERVFARVFVTRVWSTSCGQIYIFLGENTKKKKK